MVFEVERTLSVKEALEDEGAPALTAFGRLFHS